MDYSKYLKEGLMAAIRETSAHEQDEALGKGAAVSEEQLKNFMNDPEAHKDNIEISIKNIKDYIHHLESHKDELEGDELRYLEHYKNVVKNVEEKLGHSDNESSESGDSEAEKAKDLENLKSLKAKNDPTFDAAKEAFIKKYNVQNIDSLLQDEQATGVDDVEEDSIVQLIIAASTNEALSPEEITKINNLSVNMDATTVAMALKDAYDENPEGIPLFKALDDSIKAEKDVLDKREKARNEATTAIDKQNAANVYNTEVANAKDAVSKAMSNILTFAAKFNGTVKVALETCPDLINNNLEALRKADEELVNQVAGKVGRMLNDTSTTIMNVEQLRGMTAQDVWKNGFIELARITRNFDKQDKFARQQFNIGINGTKIATTVLAISGIMGTVGRVMTMIPGLAPYGKIVTQSAKIVGGVTTSLLSGKKSMDAAKNGEWGKAFGCAVGAIGGAYMAFSGVKGLNSAIGEFNAAKESKEWLENPNAKLEALKADKAAVEKKQETLGQLQTNRERLATLEKNPNLSNIDEIGKLKATIASQEATLGLKPGANLDDVSLQLKEELDAKNNAVAQGEFILQNRNAIKAQLSNGGTLGGAVDNVRAQQQQVDETKLKEVTSVAEVTANEAKKEISAEVADAKDAATANAVSDGITEITTDNDGNKVAPTDADLIGAVDKYAKQHGSFSGWFNSVLTTDPEHKELAERARTLINKDPKLVDIEKERSTLVGTLTKQKSVLESNNKMLDDFWAKNPTFGMPMDIAAKEPNQLMLKLIPREDRDKVYAEFIRTGTVPIESLKKSKVPNYQTEVINVLTSIRDKDTRYGAIKPYMEVVETAKEEIAKANSGLEANADKFKTEWDIFYHQSTSQGFSFK